MVTLWYGGIIYTMRYEGHTVEAVLEKDGLIFKTGTFKELQPLASTSVDLEGAVLYPGFVDSHLHIIGYGEKLKHLDASTMTSKQQLLEALHQRAQYLTPNDWLIAIGMNENQFEEPIFPTLEELDVISCHVIIKRACHHLIIANSKALAYAGITSSTPSPSGGIIEVSNGKLTGVLKDTALYLIVNHMPTISEEYVEDALKKAVDSLLQYGLVGGHTEDLSYYGHVTTPLQAFQKIIEQQKNFKAHLLQHHAVFEDVQKLPSLPHSPWLELGAMKIFIDGAFGGRTAALHKPYLDDVTNTGILVHTEEQLASLVKTARHYKQTVAVHAIGDRAIEVALSMFKQYPPIYAHQFDRIIHCSLVSVSLLQQLANAKVMIDVQPQFVLTDNNSLQRKLGQERMPFVNPIKSLLKRELVCAGGSDAPIETPNPLLGIYAAVTRKNKNESFVHQPTEKLTRFEAVSLYTTGAAAIIGKQQIRGMIQEGYEADFTVFSNDVFTVPIEELPHLTVKFTVVHGKIVYKG